MNKIIHVYNERFIDFSFLLIIISLALEGIYCKGYPLFWLLVGIDKNYMDFGIPTFNGLLMSFIIFYTNYLYIVFFNKKKKKHLFFLIIILIIPFIIISRQILVTTMIQLLLTHHFAIKKIKIKRVVPLLLAFLLLFGIVGNFRTGMEDFQRVSLLKNNTNISQMTSGFYWVYMYLTMPLANLNNLFTHIHFSYGYGFNMLKSFIPTILLSYFYDVFTMNSPNILISIQYNVSSFIPGPYLDFGLIGIIIYSFILGCLNSLVYHKYIFKKSLINFLVFVVLLQIMLMSFFVDFLLYLPVSFQIVWIALLKRRLLLEKSNKTND